MSDPEKFYILALKLKDIQIIDYESSNHINTAKDREIARENEKLKVEIQNLADAIDSIMRENDKKKQNSKHGDPHAANSQINELKQELQSANEIIASKNYKISELEEKIAQNNLMKTPSQPEHRFTAVDDNPYRKSSRDKSAESARNDKLIDDRMIDLENIINKIEATIFAFESRHTALVSPMENLQSTRSYHGTYPDALRDFYTRLTRIEKVTENIIQSSIRKDEQNFDDSMHHRDNHSPLSVKCKEGYEMLEREAEKLLAIADQKYEKYFMTSSVEHPDKKD